MTLRIRFLVEQDGNAVAREYVDEEPEGTFLLRGTRVVHSHPATGVTFAAPSVEALRVASLAWDAYVRHVAAQPDEHGQLRVVAAFRTELSRCGVLTEGSYWSQIVEQAEAGLL